MSKLFTLADAKRQLGRFVDQGTCSAAAITERINEACQRLTNKPELDLSPRLRKLVKFNVASNEFSLPRGVEKITAVNLQGTPAHIFTSAYQFLSSGPGSVDCMPISSCGSHLMDLGESPTQFPVPTSDTGRRIMAFTTTALETVKLKVWGYDYRNRELYEELTINSYNSGTEGAINGVPGTSDQITLSTSYFREITKVVKASTAAPVVLYAVDTSTNEMWFISKYHQKDLVPMFRRYRITGKQFHTGEDGDERHESCILGMVKMAHVELSEDDDLIPLDSIAALKLMLIAIGYENTGNLQQAVSYEAQAVRLLEDASSNHNNAQGTPVIIDVERKLSNSMMNRFPYI